MNGGGTSYLNPPTDAWQYSFKNQHLTVKEHGRSTRRRHGQMDDEGVAPIDGFPLIKNGSS